VPEWRFGEPAGGLSLWVEIPGVTAERFAAVAARHGVIVGTPGSVTVGGNDHHHLRLSFNPPVGVIDAATERLGQAWEHGLTAEG